MACVHPLPAWRSPAGRISLGKELPDAEHLALPCGGCIGCKQARAREWALRCQLELADHDSAAFTTLTYDDKHVPPTLTKRHFQLWLKRLRHRTNRPIRFFACGEYGERTQRPHYHAILFGCRDTADPEIQSVWPHGFTRTYNATPATIAYVAGYTAKKINRLVKTVVEQVDPTTGEVYTYQPPFLLMSRNPGIGANARQHIESWRDHAVHNGHKVPVPRYLHDAWLETATPQQIEDLLYERYQTRKTPTQQELENKEQIAHARQKLKTEQRQLQ